MLDAKLRPLIDPSLDRAGKLLAEAGGRADQITVAGFAIGVLAAIAIAYGYFILGLILIVANRIADGLDGAVARATRPTHRGAFLDIALDFTFYAAIPLAFAMNNPAVGLPAAFLIASFLANGAAFLAFAIVAAKLDLETTAQGVKSFFYVAGLAEGSETIAVFVAFCLWPDAFSILAVSFAILCWISAGARVVAGWKTFGNGS